MCCSAVICSLAIHNKPGMAKGMQRFIQEHCLLVESNTGTRQRASNMQQGLSACLQKLAAFTRVHPCRLPDRTRCAHSGHCAWYSQLLLAASPSGRLSGARSAALGFLVATLTETSLQRRCIPTGQQATPLIWPAGAYGSWTCCPGLSCWLACLRCKRSATLRAPTPTAPERTASSGGIPSSRVRRPAASCRACGQAAC